MSSRPRAVNVIGLLVAFVITALVAGVVGAGLAIPAVGASGLVTKDSVTFFDSLPSDLKQPALPEQSTLLAADGSKITTFYDDYRIVVPLSQISPNMQQALVAIEDARFYEHGGVDPKGLLRAAIVDKIHGGADQGASTITEQYVKNVLVNSAHVEGNDAGEAAARHKDPARKLKEIRYAVSIEKTMTKAQILEGYLNIAWFGKTVYGVQAAADYYFHTTAAKLTVVQAATLAGMVQSPADYSPVFHPTASKIRRNVVLDKMLQQKMIDQPTHDALVKRPLGTHLNLNRQGCANTGLNAYFCDYVQQLITQSDTFSSLGSTEAARQDALMRGGLTIRTTMVPKIEQAAWKATTSLISPNNKPASATVTVQPGTGKVLSIQQDKVYGSGSAKHPSDSKTTINYSVDRNYGGSAGFQTGSTFKPFTLATWLKAGKSLGAMVDGTPPKDGVPFSDFNSCDPNFGHSFNQTYHFGNASDGTETGPMSVLTATAESVNGAYVNMEKQLNLCDIRDTAQSLGVHLAAPRADICSEKKPQPETQTLPDCAPSLTLGVENISPMTMAAAYAGFAAQGKYCAPIVVTSITDRNGKQLKVPTNNCKQTMDPKVANTVTKGLSKVFSNIGTASNVGPLASGQAASGKTGTTNNSMDTWFVGYTPQLATAVWVGDPHLYTIKNSDGSIKRDPKGIAFLERHSMNNRKLNGTTYGHVFGATIAGPIWKKIMTAALGNSPLENFPPPDPKLTAASKSNVPNVNGKSVKDAESELTAAGFKPSVGSGLAQSVYPVGSVASTSPAGGTSADLGSSIVITISSGGGGGVPNPNPGNGNNNGGGGNGNPGGVIPPP